MSKADEMFNRLDYFKYLDNDNTIIYKLEKGTFRTIISFDIKNKTFHATCSVFVPKDSETWSTMEFKNDWDKYCSTQGHWESIFYDISMQELQAINEKCKELRWLEC